MRVTVDGIDFVPAAAPLLGVAITTHNRHDVIADTLAAFRLHSPNIPVVVVDDGSHKPVQADVPVLRHETPLGIPAAKNRCIAALMDLGVQHLFLFDDDTRPAGPDWWRPYVESPEPHLQFCWTHFASGQPVPKMGVVYRDDRLVGYGWSMGCMLYVTADVVAGVGGMRREFGMGMEEHAEWSQRIHNAGFTTFVHQDASGAQIWAGDQQGGMRRSFTAADRQQLLQRNEALRLSLIADASFVPFTTRDCIITSYFVTRPDPQRSTTLSSDGRPLRPLADSTAGRDMVVLTDANNVPAGMTAIPTQAALCAYEQRWISQWQYLRDHPEIRWCWLVDGTDVRLLNDPFPHMKPATLYVGWEPERLGCDWIRSHSPNHLGWIDDHAQEMLLNTGVVGGDRATVMSLCRTMIDLWAQGNRCDPLEEMTLFNIAARQHTYITGSQVATVFKANTQTHPTAWFAHK